MKAETELLRSDDDDVAPRRRPVDPEAPNASRDRQRRDDHAASRRHDEDDLSRAPRMTRDTMASAASSVKPFSGNRPAVLAVLVLIVGSLSWNKVDLSRYLPRDDSFNYSEMMSTPETNNATVSRPPGITAENATNATISSSSSRLLEGQANRTSPACGPHFRLALPDGGWTSDVKFKRLYFYHARKAGGTNLRNYFRKVAAHHGLQFAVDEYVMAEDPGTHDEATFYVTNLREPVSRSISHFKYDTRWDCAQLINNTTFVPTEENAKNLSEWNQQFGFELPSCRFNKDGSRKFKMAQCAVNCYSQWFSGLSCPWWDPPAKPGPGLEGRPIRREVPMARQYEVAKARLLRYNFVVITEMLRSPGYAAAIERFFGVPGAAARDASPWCEVESHHVNERIPLVVRNETRRNLARLNEVDIGLYGEMRECLDAEEGGGYDFPEWDPGRFERNETIQLDHTKVFCTSCRKPKIPLHLRDL